LKFIDTNILLYSISTVPEEKRKAETARRLLKRTDLALSVQVLQEFYVQATHKAKRDRITHEQATALIESWLRFKIREVDVTLMQAAFETAQRFQISYWDAAIVEAGRSLGCRQILSEDMNDGQSFAGVVVRNPFRTAAVST
jgi:predicted nucleic acid-binding protein